MPWKPRKGPNKAVVALSFPHQNIVFVSHRLVVYAAHDQACALKDQQLTRYPRYVNFHRVQHEDSSIYGSARRSIIRLTNHTSE
jgi:hypothetical protein